MATTSTSSSALMADVFSLAQRVVRGLYAKPGCRRLSSGIRRA